MTTRGLSLVGLGVLTLALGACVGGSPTDSTEDSIGETAQKIIGGTPATAYPEAVLVDILQGGQLSMGCSGTVIAPRVVLTAGHCVADGDGWNITAPYASGQTAHGSSKAVFDWTQTNDQVSPDEHDVGLVFLDSDITLSSYPTIATAGLANNANIVTVGRVKGGQLSHSALYVSAPQPVHADTQYGFNFDYSSSMSIERGDSGGASYAANTHTIVSVNSTGNSTTELLARVDLVESWIQQQIAAHGGGGSGGTTPSGGQGGSAPTGGQGGSDPAGGQGGSDPGEQPGTGGAGPGTPHGPPPGYHHCVFIPWWRMYYCW